MRLACVTSIALVVAATAAWAAIQTSSVQSLSAGTVFQAAGEGFGRKPAAWLENDQRKIPLRVAPDGTDTQQTLKLRGLPRNSAGPYDLRIRPKGQKTPFSLAGMVIELPSVSSVSPPAAARRAEVTIEGEFFGVKKGRVRIDGRPAKVLSWTDTAIRVRVPDTQTTGLVFLDVMNQAGPAPRSTFTVSQ